MPQGRGLHLGGSNNIRGKRSTGHLLEVILSATVVPNASHTPHSYVTRSRLRIHLTRLFALTTLDDSVTHDDCLHTFRIPRASSSSISLLSIFSQPRSGSSLKAPNLPYHCCCPPALFVNIWPHPTPAARRARESYPSGRAAGSMSSLRPVSNYLSFPAIVSHITKSSPLARRSISPTPMLPANVLSSPPSNSQIEAVIQMATSNAALSDARNPGRDTRTQLFVGNVSPYASTSILTL